MSTPLMPKATALWLIENTTLTFDQISEFCGLHVLEIQALADGDIGAGLAPFDPITNNQLTLQEIKRCENDSNTRLALLPPIDQSLSIRKKGSRYTPLSRRGDRPNAIAWILKNYPEMRDSDIIHLVGTTKNTIEAIKNRTHKNTQTIKPSNPVTLGLCTQADLDEAVNKINKSSKTTEQ
ncbi:cell cycle transcriptional regulator TrcR [Candidatus Nucleicultrix amoebiphila]|jgi:hypothetical protein|uniref:cell cycle transcriptional regulator TrcR n=1 Tax=Candidatus Nucleicultrix amoebiphila TaxID=1509244 RepID=UPI000A2721D5|nr:cell cycle transcriptional regulator TrcR [Candidatus Nucleicultrix amoebiphila]